MRKKRFILVGEDSFARKTVEVIRANSHGELACVFTSMEREGTLHRYCRQHEIPLFDSECLNSTQPPKLVADWLINVNSALILPTSVLGQFPNRALNLHNGPLPQYAGRHVHQWGLRNGERTFAATIHHMEAGIDTGDIVLAKEFEISRDDTGLSTFRKSFETGVQAFSEVLETIMEDKILSRFPQNPDERRIYSHKEALDSRIDWNWTARKICDFVRAGNYYPLASPTYSAKIPDFSGEEIVVLKAQPCSGKLGQAGEIQMENGFPLVACASGAVMLVETTRGGKKMTLDDWSSLLPDKSSQPLSGRSADGDSNFVNAKK